jgi:hypothetical protein
MGSPADTSADGSPASTGADTAPAPGADYGDALKKAGASLGSITGGGLAAYGDIYKSQGVAAGDIFKAQRLEENAQRGKVAAVETGADLSTRLATTLGNIDAMRAAGRGDPTSPTAAAYRDMTEQRGLSQKAIAIDQILAQSRQQEAEAVYLRSAAKSALLAGKISAGADVAAAIGKALTAGA